MTTSGNSNVPTARSTTLCVSCGTRIDQGRLLCRECQRDERPLQQRTERRQKRRWK